ncbi:hypothetical protein, variant [Aphanomyces invadans]|uniref:Mannosyltransferase n=1 Tax=Aphanomyces invadans TaxID=157072 RepID=A0A024UVT3_9STRA|nr:hypothetical protein, variant [Aphanomyces invadans]ETW10429.1 hypothetical protein, variant [Aphanomyces invadans]|eukprot:XP_008861840.1 hypothetical protein, variant [Aphanomyces invadans]
MQLPRIDSTIPRGRTRDMMEDVALYAIGLFQVWFTPYAKVEESFNLQACHDLLYHGVNLTQYDHFEFPGVVPRTFLGALPVALLSSPFLHFLRPSKPAMQILVRSSLWTLSFLAWRTFKQTISTLHGCDTGVWFTLVSMVQFHVVYYMSRTLPNTFALMLVFVAYSFWMKNQPKAFIALMSISTIVFRGDTAVLFAPILLSMLVTRQISFVMTIATGVLSTVVALATTIFVDSFFWQRWLWPEGEVLWFNTVLNKSHEWGTHPFHWYFASALPRIMLTTVLLLPLGATSLGSVVSGSKSIPEMIQTLRAAAFVDSATCKYFVPVVLYVFLFSFLPHKELRFVLNAVPMLNYVAAVGATKVWRNRTKNRWPVVVALGSIVLTLAGSVVFTLASHANYPGGVAFQRLHELTSTVQHIPKTVHIDVAAAMTGVSRFGEQSSTWTYVKTEGFNTTAHFAPFDYLLTADPSHPSKKVRGCRADVFVLRRCVGVCRGRCRRRLRPR